MWCVEQKLRRTKITVTRCAGLDYLDQLSLRRGRGVFPIQASYIDKSLPIPVGTQLRGLLVTIIAHGSVEPGSRLPSVRDLAADLGIAVVTVAQVYQQLESAGLIEIRRGLGAFTLDDPGKPPGPATMLSDDIDALLQKAANLGVPAIDLVTMISGRAQLRSSSGLNIVFVSPFLHTTRRYIDDIRPAFQVNDKVSAATVEQLQDEKIVRRCQRADVVLTVANREHEVRKLLPQANLIPLRLTISEESRSALTALPAETRIAAVMSVQDYIATLRPGILSVAPHLSDIRVTWLKAPDLKDILNSREVIVYTSGAESVLKLAPGHPGIEYRYTPDPRHVQNALVPALAELRSARSRPLQR